MPGVRHGAGARGCGAEAWMSELSKPRAHERSLIRTRTADGRIPAKLGGQVPAQPQTHAVPVERGPNSGNVRRVNAYAISLDPVAVAFPNRQVSGDAIDRSWYALASTLGAQAHERNGRLRSEAEGQDV